MGQWALDKGSSRKQAPAAPGRTQMGVGDAALPEASVLIYMSEHSGRLKNVPFGVRQVRMGLRLLSGCLFSFNFESCVYSLKKQS